MKWKLGVYRGCLRAIVINIEIEALTIAHKYISNRKGTRLHNDDDSHPPTPQMESQLH